MTLVKICGITNLDDALAAVAAGADALGFNFYRPSPRYLTASAARTIIERLPARVLAVGVFVNEAIETLENTAAVSGISAVQLHGNESPEYCNRLQGRYLIKVFPGGEASKPESALAYDVQAIMLDADANETFGGTGRLADWSRARQLAELFPRLILAGGLAPENVAQAIARVHPYAVDACSKLECAPGRKDNARMHEFVAAVRAADGTD
jgi:phosphoribosylanthranilate isomerase